MSGTKSTSRKSSAKQLQAAEQQKNREALVQLRLDGDYPATLSALAQHSGLTMENAAASLKAKGLKEQLVHFDIGDSSLVVFVDDADRLAADTRVLTFFAGKVLAKRQAEGKSLRGTVSKFVTDAKTPTSLKAALTHIIDERFKQNDLPTAIAELLTPPKVPKPPKAPKLPKVAKPPKPHVPTPREMATRLVDVLVSQRQASTSSYPVPIDRLFELAEFAALPKRARDNAIKDSVFVDQVAYCGPRPGDVSTSKACIVKSDLKPLLPKLAQRAFEYALTNSSLTAEGGGRTTMFAAAAIGGAMLMAKADQELFTSQFDAQIERAEPLLGLGWLEIKGKRQYFRLADVHSVGMTGSAGQSAPQFTSPAESSPTVTPQRSIDQPPQATPQFAVDFDAAFRRIDSRGGNRNYVKVYDLREELPQYDRAAFDAGLRRVRESKQYTMDSAQGGYASLTEAERRAGIQEGSSLLVYVTRKT